jgi:hypothetical protein
MAEVKCREQLDIALLRMTEKKMIAEQMCKQYEIKLQQRDARI